MSTLTETPIADYTRSRELQRRAHQLIPGGCHTYAKGDDQFPQLSPGFIARGQGCHVWDVDGNEYIEYGMGCRAVTLGHGHEEVVRAAQAAMEHGLNFTRPAPIEVEAAEELLGMIPGGEMVKFAKNGSDVTTAALKLARAATGRDHIALCASHPFFSTDDWFIGTTAIDSGIPQSVKDLTLTFRYNEIDSVQKLFAEHSGEIAALILEPAKQDEPADGFLHKVQQLCRENGTVLILDEMITGFRWHNGGAQHVYNITPDLSTFGKAFANGFSASALVGRRDLMERGGLHHSHDRVFLLSTTHGAESHALAAAIATMRVYQREPVIEDLHRQGVRLQNGLNQIIAAHGLTEYVRIPGRPCSLVFAALDHNGQSSQLFRSLLMQEIIRRGILAPSLVVSHAHTDEDIDRTIDAFDGALDVYSRALNDGPEQYLVGPPTQVVYRRRNGIHPGTGFVAGEAEAEPPAGNPDTAPAGTGPHTTAAGSQPDEVAANIGEDMLRLMRELFPVCRSITGEGVRWTLRHLQNMIPLAIHEVPTGTQVLDWTVPREWNIRDAWIRDADGQKLVDYQQCNLHVVGGSVPVRQRLRWHELKHHLKTLPDHPDWTPYRTAFHQDTWGFCLPHRQFNEIERRGDSAEYEVFIDSSLRDGSLTFGELYLPGETDAEILITTHVCHPSLANDNLSGIAVAAFAARHFARQQRRYSFRFLFAPATIGAITWLALNRQQTDRIRHGMVLAVLGDGGCSTWRRSRRQTTEIDRAAEHVLSQAGPCQILDFEPFGYDQRQFCSPGFNLPMGSLMRTPNGEYPEYHTSADDLSFVRADALADSLSKCIRICHAVDRNRTYCSTNPYGEPRLDRHGLYQAFGSGDDEARRQRAVQWVLNLSDGEHSLLDIAERSKTPFNDLHAAAQSLLDCGLLEPVDRWDCRHSPNEGLLS